MERVSRAVYIADGFGKIVEGTLIGSNLGSGIATHSHTGFVFDAGIRDRPRRRIAGRSGAGEAFVQWVDADPSRLKMARPEFDAILRERENRNPGPVSGAPK